MLPLTQRKMRGVRRASPQAPSGVRPRTKTNRRYIMATAKKPVKKAAAKKPAAKKAAAKKPAAKKPAAKKTAKK